VRYSLFTYIFLYRIANLLRMMRDKILTTSCPTLSTFVPSSTTIPPLIQPIIKPVHYYTTPNSIKRKYTSNVRSLNQNPKNKKASEHQTPFSIAHSLESSCCTNASCNGKNFTIHEVEQIRALYYTYASEFEKTKYLCSLLQSLQSLDSSQTC